MKRAAQFSIALGETDRPAAMTSVNPSPILWSRVLALGGVQGAITLCWIAYRLYLPVLLVQWGMDARLAALLLFWEGLLGIACEPLFGFLSDRQYRHLGSRFPLIALGTITASGLFISLPAIVIFGQGSWRWLLPGIALLWALAMTLFRSPILVLLGTTASQYQLPMAASVLTLITGGLGSLRPVLKPLILHSGAPLIFALGSLLLLCAVGLVRWCSPSDPPVSATEPTPAIPWTATLAIAGIALGVGWSSKLIMGQLETILQAPSTLVILGLILAIAAIPAGAIAHRWHNQPMMISGLGGLALVVGLLYFGTSPNLVGIAVLLLICAWNFVQNGVFPLIFQAFPSRWVGLGMGIYFGTLGGVSSLFDSLIAPLPLPIKGLIAWGGLLITAICLRWCDRLKTTKTT